MVLALVAAFSLMSVLTYACVHVDIITGMCFWLNVVNVYVVDICVIYGILVCY